MDESIIRELEQQQARQRLAQAIRGGAAIRPQCFGTPFVDGKSCALGAAYEGATGRYEEHCPNYELVAELLGMGAWPIDLDPQQVFHRNDVNGMTREQIADWIEEGCR